MRVKFNPHTPRKATVMSHPSAGKVTKAKAASSKSGLRQRTGDWSCTRNGCKMTFATEAARHKHQVAKHGGSYIPPSMRKKA